MTNHSISFRDIVDIDELKKLFEAFSTATGFTTGLVDKTADEILINTGWRDICVKFHRANPASEKHCKSSGRILTTGLNTPGEIKICHCENGLVDGCTPIIIEGKHLANLVTGQIFFEPPDINRFKKQAGQYDYDEQAYLDAVSEVPVVTEKAFKAMLLFLSRLATTTAKIGLSNLRSKRDQRKQDKLMTQLHHAQKMEAIGMMAGGVAHDLNNILSGIVGYPELMLRALPESSELRAPIKAIQESGKRAANVVDDLLTVARGASSIREPHSVNQLIGEYLNSPECKQLASLYPDILCKKQLNAEHSIISCSPIHIKKAVMNLLMNAIEASDHSGNVTVLTSNVTIDKSKAIELEMNPGNYLVLTVQDNGKGITASELEHIFEPFYTKKAMGRSGTGLGLAVVWNMVEDHDGKIFVKSNEKGTDFQLYFSTVQKTEKKTSTDDNNSRESITGNGEHILVVDDEPHLRDIARKMLQSLGYKVDVASSGNKAIQCVKNTEFDLIVLDMLMEPGINGRKTYEEILKLNPNQHAIVASGFSKSNDVKATIQLGASGFIKKPYSINQLGRVIKKALNS